MALTKVSSGLISADASSVDLNIDAGTLYIDATNNRVGIGTASPDTLNHLLTSTTSAITPVLKLQGNFTANDSSEGTSIDFVGSSDATAVGSRIIGTRAAAGGNMDLRFHTARDTFAMIIDESQNVGIGTTSPSAKLELNGGDAYFYNTASTGGIRIGYDASNYWDVKRENASIGNLRFYSNGTERVSFLPGGGITFNGDTAAANALDDYEEGTWTPSLTNATGTFTSGGATYTKVGRIVTVNFRLNPSGTAGVVANSTYINNLPISINATSITPVGAFTDVSSSTAGIMGMHGAVSTRIYFTTSYSTGGYISGTLTYESA